MNSTLNVKKWITATLAAFVVMSVLEYLLHGVLLRSWYQEYPHYWLPEAEMMSRMHWMYLGYLLFSGLFCYIYTKGYEGKPGLGEGMRYGLLAGSLVGLPAMFIDHAVFYYPGKIIVSWGIGTIVICMIMGVVAGKIYTKEQAAI